MDCWDKEEMEFGLKRKRRSLDLFSGNSFETVPGITEDLVTSNNIDPAGELKELDLIRCLMKSSSSSKDNNLASYSSGVDCTLSLGLPHTVLSPEEQHAMHVLKEKTMQASFNVIQIMKSKLLSHKITNSELEASYNIVAPFSGLYNMSSSANNNIYRSQPYKSCMSTAGNAATTSITTTWSSNTHSSSNLMDSKDILAFKNYATGLGSELLLPTRPSKTSNSSPVRYNNGSSIRIVQQKQIRNLSSDDAARSCSTCHTTTTPLWRNGPKGAKSLCNACGIRYKKEVRRVASAMAAAAETNNQFVKAPCSNSIGDHDNHIPATPQLKPLKKLKL
ncbi:hypothetical protein SUGI_0198520 [Cryptomeria japonica]|uniref:GATA transcription factor 11 n=1 Tax=Cryptomeria japonica TaxID=3369 RepID=UPI00240898C0|nr:GATA transcription factor 11 [Cryptomeria japonica]GLJ12826.1 hypothetical protein SUGI_0198520 [Cryptomeria japonica]